MGWGLFGGASCLSASVSRRRRAIGQLSNLDGDERLGSWMVGSMALVSLQWPILSARTPRIRRCQCGRVVAEATALRAARAAMNLGRTCIVWTGGGEW